MFLKTFYIERFGFIPIISYKITSVLKYYALKTENTIMNSQLTEDKLIIKPKPRFTNL